MSDSVLNITSYLKSPSRNRIVLSKEVVDGVDYCDLGKDLSGILKKLDFNKSISLKTKHIISDYLDSKLFDHPQFGDLLAIKNVGILLEPELKIDFVALVDSYSKSNSLFIEWKGDEGDGLLYHLDKNKGLKYNIKNLSYMML